MAGRHGVDAPPRRSVRGRCSDRLRELLDRARHTGHLLGGRFRPSSASASRRRHTAGPGRGGDQSGARASVRRERLPPVGGRDRPPGPEVRPAPRVHVCHHRDGGRAGPARSRVAGAAPSDRLHRVDVPQRRPRASPCPGRRTEGAGGRGGTERRAPVAAHAGVAAGVPGRDLALAAPGTHRGRVDRNGRSRSRRRLDVLGGGRRPRAAGADRGNAGPRGPARAGALAGPSRSRPSSPPAITGARRASAPAATTRTCGCARSTRSSASFRSSPRSSCRSSAPSAGRGPAAGRAGTRRAAPVRRRWSRRRAVGGCPHSPAPTPCARSAG